MEDLVRSATSNVRGSREVVASATHSKGEVLVEVSNLGKTFSDGQVVAVEDANLAVRSGEFVSLVGPSGCGKSTLLRMLAGLIDPSSGRIEIEGRVVDGPHTDVGMMFQKATLLEWRTSVENVLLPTELGGNVTDEDRRSAMALLDTVGLQGFEFSFPSQLSGGMQQRVALARLLQTGAAILLLDEPFGALDEFTRERLNIELMRIVAEVSATTFFVTHNIQEAILLADRVVVMTPHPGRVAKIVEVPFERPRRLEMQLSSEFNALVAQVRSTLGESP